MSTNATIKVSELTCCKLYKHWDGHPISTLPFLEFFNKKFTEDRGVDPEYKMAQLIRATSKYGEEFKLDQSEETGWGVIGYYGYKGSYEYILEDDGTVTVHSF